MATLEKEVQLPQDVREASVNVSDAERLISALGGGALAAAGVKRRDWGGVAMATLGGALLARGVTGHCPVNAATGRNTAVKPHYNLKVESA